MGKNKCVFNNIWFYDVNYKDWLMENKKSENLFGCKICRKHDLELSNTGEKQLIQHMGSKKNIKKSLKPRKKWLLFLHQKMHKLLKFARKKVLLIGNHSRQR